MNDHYDQYTKIGLFNAPAPISDMSLTSLGNIYRHFSKNESSTQWSQNATAKLAEVATRKFYI